MDSNTELLGYITQYLPDNDSQLIDPADLRYVLAAMVQAKASVGDLANFAQLAGAHFSGLVEVPTAPAGTSSQQAASTAFVQAAVAAIASGKNLSELVLPQDVAAGNWYLTADGFWEARRSFNAAAAPANGPNWRQVASFSGQLTSLSAANITDATDAGRAMLLAPTAAAQRALVNNPRIAAGQYGNHPAFNSEDGPNGLNAWILKAVMTVASVQVVQQPAAPTNVEVNDVSKEWLVKLTAAYPSYAQYGITGLPGTVGEVALGANNAYQVSDVLHIKVGSAAAKGNLSLRVIGSGNVPNGMPLVNPDAFTGAVTTTPTQPATTSLTAGLAIAVASIMAGNPLTFTVTAGGGAGGYTYAVMATSTTTGTSILIGSAASGSWTPTKADDYDITATVTDSAGVSKTSPVRALHVSGAPLANAGSDLVLTQPASSATLQGSGYEQAGTITGYSWNQTSGPVNVTFSSKTVAQPPISGLTAVGDYRFNLVVTDAQGNVSLADEVVITVQAAAVTLKDPHYALDGDSIGTEDYAIWHDLLETGLTNLHASLSPSQLAAVGLTTAAPTFSNLDYVAISGQTAAQMNSAAGDVDGRFIPGKANILLPIGEPFNSYRGPANKNVTAQQGADDFIAYCLGRKASNAWFKIIALVGFRDRYRGTNTDYNPARADIDQVIDNALSYLQNKVSAGTAGVDVLALVDPGFDPTNPTDSDDGIHPKRPVYQNILVPRLVAGVKQALVGTPQPAPVPKPATATATGALLAGAQYISFPTQINLVPAGQRVTVRQDIGQTGDYGFATGLADVMLAAGQDGRIMLPVMSDRDGIVYITESYSRAAKYNSGAAKLGIWLSSNGVLGIINAGVAGETTIALSSYLYFCLHRAGSTWTLEGWDGSTWVPLKTLNYGGTGNAYIQCDVFSKTGAINCVQGTNLSPVAVATGPNYVPNGVALTATGGHLVTTNAITTNNSADAYGHYENGGGSTGYQVAPGTNGSFGHRILSASDYDAVVGGRIPGTPPATVNGTYTAFLAGVWVSTPEPTAQGKFLASLINGTASPTSSIPQQIGLFDFVFVAYDSSANTTTLTPKYSLDGTSWTPYGTPVTVQGTVSVLVEVCISGPGQLSCLQGVNVVPV